jgi:hypothetical protein
MLAYLCFFKSWHVSSLIPTRTLREKGFASLSRRERDRG